MHDISRHADVVCCSIKMAARSLFWTFWWCCTCLVRASSTFVVINYITCLMVELSLECKVISLKYTVICAAALQQFELFCNVQIECSFCGHIVNGAVFRRVSGQLSKGAETFEARCVSINNFLGVFTVLWPKIKYYRFSNCMRARGFELYSIVK